MKCNTSWQQEKKKNTNYILYFKWTFYHVDVFSVELVTHYRDNSAYRCCHSNGYNCHCFPSETFIFQFILFATSYSRINLYCHCSTSPHLLNNPFVVTHFYFDHDIGASASVLVIDNLQGGHQEKSLVCLSPSK